MTLLLKRAYEPAGNDDGERFLVDRLWPRGVSKVNAHLTGWLKELAPSTELRKWFGHDPARWAEFRRRYASELDRPDARSAMQMIADKAQHGTGSGPFVEVVDRVWRGTLSCDVPIACVAFSPAPYVLPSPLISSIETPTAASPLASPGATRARASRRG